MFTIVWHIFIAFIWFALMAVHIWQANESKNVFKGLIHLVIGFGAFALSMAILAILVDIH